MINSDKCMKAKWKKKRGKELWYLYDSNGVSIAAVRMVQSSVIVPVLGPVMRYRTYLSNGVELRAEADEYTTLRDAQNAAKGRLAASM